MTSVLMILSAADHWTLKDGSKHPTGFWAEEFLAPYNKFKEAGWDVVVATPGAEPVAPGGYGAAIVVDTDRNVIVGATFVGQDVADMVHAATIANVTSTTGSRQIGTVRRARRVRRHRIAVASALGTFSVTTPTAVGTDAGGGTGTGAGASGTPKRPATASCTTIFHLINGSR